MSQVGKSIGTCIAALLLGCAPDESAWNLPPTNPIHEDYYALCLEYDGSSLQDVSAELTNGADWHEWSIQEEFGNDFYGSMGSGRLGFDFSTNQNFIVVFRMSSYFDGNHDTPMVTWNGVELAAPVTSGATDIDGWVERQTETISSGSGILEIEFPFNSSIYSRRIDFVRFLCAE